MFHVFSYVNRISIFENFYGRKLAHLREFSLITEMNSTKNVKRPKPPTHPLKKDEIYFVL